MIKKSINSIDFCLNLVYTKDVLILVQYVPILVRFGKRRSNKYGNTGNDN